MHSIAVYPIAFLSTAALPHLLSPVARNIGLIDIPRGHKTHLGEVPLVGGIAMFCGFLFANLRLPGRPRALVFMGNSGSLFLGLGLAWFVVGP
ncbi:hypothetical protein [Candidatus Thiodictyon syntrophicum]|jgi:UDP-GlcNAc:undecaprenyl-phosphate GlcNAc-1-phosphate transferase|uniref:Undecaprenyl-phosphate alpha-N-acetylglucosaminyl 1-phosphate transferase n=1 Tax=Candidatus Thiodictyon syntrophicum TaxID=1166950 RepID=A0A2K8U791_9GAMM|nr:hypothetical protein [Candidatus Thiodictyon syntrophicum]AUB81424.1 hypothetical protein THSYN_10980 [Candidatus Thiodictyon syntrophicum]